MVWEASQEVEWIYTVVLRRILGIKAALFGVVEAILSIPHY